MQELMDVTAVLELVRGYYPVIGKKCAEGKQYGTLSVRGHFMSKRPTVALVPFGVIPDESECYVYAQEKNERLRANPNHVSSFQSRDPKKKRWAGAIRLIDSSAQIGYMSWSGYPELVDEAFMLAIAVRASIMTISDAQHIVTISENPHFDSIREIILR